MNSFQQLNAAARRYEHRGVKCIGTDGQHVLRATLEDMLVVGMALFTPSGKVAMRGDAYFEPGVEVAGFLDGLEAEAVKILEHAQEQLRRLLEIWPEHRP